ncbi:MAG: sensor histidine kinase [Deferrisomatales bacterium]
MKGHRTPPGAGIPVLIAEDSPTQALELEHLLVSNGYRVTVAANGREALEKLRADPPALVLSDVVMPELDGYQLCRAVKQDEALRQVPVVLLTSLQDPEDVLQGLACGADNFLTKPCPDEVLLRRVSHILANVELRKNARMQVGVELLLGGRRHFITAERQQILDLLISTYEEAVRKNGEVAAARARLEELNAGLERRVEERTRELRAEVAEREQTEDRLRRSLTALASANEELDRFAYVASHDLQEPLRMVTSYLQLLERRCGVALDGDGREFLAFAVDGAARMRRLIQDLLTLSRVGTRGGAFAPVGCQEVLAGALDRLAPELEETGARVGHGPLPEVLGDREQLVDLFRAVLDNALKFRGEAPPEVHVSARREGREWVFSVADNGLGIDPAHFDRIFVIFQRLHGPGAYPGTGLGLALAKKIVERHGGRIWVESAPGQGATFSFTLPAAAGGGR